MSDHNTNDLNPAEGLRLYVSQREPELRESTIKSIRSRVGIFTDWCQENGIEALQDLDGMDIHRYRAETAEQVSQRTLACRLSDLRNFLRWARDVDAVDPELPERITIPDADRARTRHLTDEQATAIIDYLRKYHYASRDHVAMLLFWWTGARLGAIRSLDVEDYDPDGEYIEFHHRPETDTPLKNGPGGERPVALPPETCTVVDDYLARNRADQTDEHGREPLITTQHGRMSIVSFRRTVYRLTRPCVYQGECPHDRDPAGCDAANDYDKASQCPSTVSPHDVRRGAITHLCRNEVPTDAISDRCDVSRDVLEKHYNQLTEQEKMEQRRSYVEDL